MVREKVWQGSGSVVVPHLSRLSWGQEKPPRMMRCLVAIRAPLIPQDGTAWQGDKQEVKILQNEVEKAPGSRRSEMSPRQRQRRRH